MNFSPVGNHPFFDVDGKPLVAGLIWTYEAGTTTYATTYADQEGVTIHSNPIMLNSYGLPGAPIWLQENVSYKFVIEDSNGNLFYTYDDIGGINDKSEIVETLRDEWILSETTPYFIDGSSFYLVGDQTDKFHKFRRVKLTTLSAGNIYGSVITTAYDLPTNKTTITVRTDDDGPINENILAAYYGILSYAPMAYPNFLSLAQWMKKGTPLTITNNKLDIWGLSGNYVDVFGTGTLVDFGKADQEGSLKYLRFRDTGVIVRNNLLTINPKGVDLYLTQGDILQVIADANGVNRVIMLMSNAPELIPTYDAPLQTRQTVITGPSSVQAAIPAIAPYYELPQLAMTGLTSNGFTASAVGASNNPGDAWTIFNKVWNFGMDSKDGAGWMLTFPELYWVNKFYLYFDSQYWPDYVIVYGLLSDDTEVTLWSGQGNFTGAYINIAPIRIKRFRLYGDNWKENGWRTFESIIYGYKATEITAPTVSTQTETLLQGVQYTKATLEMTSASQSGFIASASSEQSTNYAYQAFNSDALAWATNSNANEWIKLQFPVPTIIGRMSIATQSVALNLLPVSFKVQASNDNLAWTDLLNITSAPVWIASSTQTFDFYNITEYLYYRLLVNTIGVGGVRVTIPFLAFHKLLPDYNYGSIQIVPGQTDTVITIAGGFSGDGQVDYTFSLLKQTASCPITPLGNNFIYLVRNPTSGQVSYESKTFAPVYGTYNPLYLPGIPNLLRGDGISGSTTIVDSYGNTSIALTGSIVNSATEFKWGTGSVLFSTNGSVLKIPRNFGIIRDVWTIDFWWRPTTLTGNIDLINTTPSYSVLLSYNRGAATKLALYISSNGSAWNVGSAILGTKANFVANQWYYIKVAFLGRRYVVWVDGVIDIQILSELQIWQITSMNIGAYNGEASSPTGYIDDFRFRPGVGDFNEATGLPAVPTGPAEYVKPWIFNINEMKGYLKEEDGSLNSTQMIALGEAQVSNLTNFNTTPITYAYNGRKQISWTTFNPVTDDWLVLPHNLGTDYFYPDININSPNATTPYTSLSISPIEGVGMYSGANTWGGIPMGRIIDRLNYRIRYPASNSADYVAAYGGSGVLSLITGDIINLAGTFLRGF